MLAISLPADQQQIEGGGADDFLQQRGPFLCGPIFLRAATAWMKRECGRGWSRRFLEGKRKARDMIGSKNSQSLEWPKKSLRRVQTGFFVRPVRASNELRFGTAIDICLKNPVRIV